ncbi:MAG: thioredoxin domain-containing protein [Terracidiphilus sp.]|nr:thioredoxin domain-containing protein [Terracidiphilus sp.]
MPHSFAHTFRTRLNFLFVLASAALVASALPAHAQFGAPATTQVHDASALHPPAGSRVAIVEFADLECPDCAAAYPMVRDAVAKYKIPLVYHDFPLPFHNWSFFAAVNARWFDAKNKKLGEDYRAYIFTNQRSIKTPADLTASTQTFAKDHKLLFPHNPDPKGLLAAAVKADYALGQRIGVEHTPTIWVVTAGTKGAPFIEVLDKNRLFQMVEQALAKANGR